MSYNRVCPRDLFNESKLLKCLGKLLGNEGDNDIKGLVDAVLNPSPNNCRCEMDECEPCNDYRGYWLGRLIRNARRQGREQVKEQRAAETTELEELVKEFEFRNDEPQYLIAAKELKAIIDKRKGE